LSKRISVSWSGVTGELGMAINAMAETLTARVQMERREQSQLRTIMSSMQEALVVVDRLTAEAPKTKPFGRLAKTFQAAHRSLLILHEPNETLLKSLRNLAAFELCGPDNLNAFDVLNAKKLLVTKDALARLEQRVKDAAGN